MENIGQKKKQIQVGIKCYFQRDKKGRIIPEGTTSEPIYQDWTPELQKGYDEMMNNFAKILADELFKAIGNGLDITKLGTIYADDFFKEQAEKKKRKQELAKIKRKMTDEDLEESLKWKTEKK